MPDYSYPTTGLYGCSNHKSWLPTLSRPKEGGKYFSGKVLGWRSYHGDICVIQLMDGLHGNVCNVGAIPIRVRHAESWWIHSQSSASAAIRIISGTYCAGFTGLMHSWYICCIQSSCLGQLVCIAIQSLLALTQEGVDQVKTHRCVEHKDEHVSSYNVTTM